MSSVYLFRTALYELMFVLDKDALLHCYKRLYKLLSLQ